MNFLKTGFINCCCVLLMLASLSASGQGNIPTKGKDFWIGFPRNPLFSAGFIKRCEVFITSETNTSGTISIPQQGWSQTFTVIANQTTTINLPIIQVEHLTSEFVENKGVEVLTNDTVSVFAISFQQYSADATIVYPKQSLGTEYRIASYQGLQSSGGDPPNMNSDFLIVATEDDTQINITPTVPTLNGQAAGVPFTIMLDKGESYQVLSSSYNQDLTGTVIEATDSSGSCRPFAVFSGSVCVNIPVGCASCDILYDQAIPVAHWGKVYNAVPFDFATNYTLRILADQNATSYTVNGGAPMTLNAGQFNEINNITDEKCIVSNKPISVIQYMQGGNCASNGDPSMMYLNSEDQKIDQVTFSTVTSAVITQHNVNVIMRTSNIGQLSLDGVPVPASSFSTFTSNVTMSYAQLSLTQGSHTLNADSGFTAYSYGTGSAESYAYSVGSYSKLQAINVDSVLCSNDTMYLSAQNQLFNTWWSTSTNPNDTIGLGPVLTLVPPILPDIYVAKGNEFISGCERTFYFQVEVPIPPVIYATGSAVQVCQNQQVQLNAGTIPASNVYQYSWTPAIGLSNPNIANPVLTATTSMWYVVAVSSPSGCINTVYDSTYINVVPLPLPTVNAGANQTICPGDSALLSVSGGVTYLWSPGASTNDSIHVSPLVTTNYIVFLTDNNGCQNSDTVKVIVNPLPNADAGPDLSVCPGTPATLTATGGVSYLWTPGTSQNPFVVTPNTNTTYTVLVTDVNGCQNTDSITISMISGTQISLGPDTSICPGMSVTLTFPAGATYLWTPGGLTTNAITVTPLTTTTYIGSISMGAGCIQYDTITVNVVPLAANLGPNQTVCIGDSVVLTTAAGYTYSWTPMANATNSLTVFPTSTSYYKVTATNSLGCQAADSLLVSVNLLPVANAGNDITVCNGTAATLTAALTGTTYTWLPPAINNSTINVTPAATTTYFLKVTDINGCKNYDTVTVFVNQLPIANAGPDSYICGGMTSTLTATGGLSYLWTPGNLTNQTISVSPIITSNYSVEVTDINGCKNTDMVTVNITSLPVADFLLPDTICESSPLSFVNTSTTSIGSIVASQWTFGDGSLDDNSSNPIHSYATEGNYFVQLLIINSIGCRDSILKPISVNPNPIIDFTGENVCLNELVHFDDLSVIVPGTLSSWTWNFGDGHIESVQNPVHPYKEAGLYDIMLTVMSDLGCVKTGIKENFIEVHDLPKAEFNYHPESVSILNPVVEFTDQSSGGNAWEWNFGDGIGTSNLVNPSYTYSDTGSFLIQLKLTNNFGCVDTQNVRLIVDPYTTLYIPNSFTPNEDGLNDVFMPVGLGLIDFKMIIFDRWGAELFITNSLLQGWNGKFQGTNEFCMQDAYVYKIVATDNKSNTRTHVGKIVLIR